MVRFLLRVAPAFIIYSAANAQVPSKDIIAPPTDTSDKSVVSLSAVPSPIVGAGLPGLVAGCIGLVTLARRRRKRV